MTERPPHSWRKIAISLIGSVVSVIACLQQLLPDSPHGPRTRSKRTSSLNFLDKHTAALQEPLPYYISTGINDLRSPVASESVIPPCHIGADHPHTMLKCQGNISISRRRVQFWASALV